MNQPLELLQKMLTKLLVTILLVSGIQNICNAENQLTPITLQLQWNHQFQFAGYYAAIARGFYREAGLDVTIHDGGYDETGHAVQPEVEVLFNRAQFGTTRTDLLINYDKGLPVVVLANIMQHSPFIFLTTENFNLNRLEQIGYERPVTLNINETGNNRIDAEAVAALKVTGLELARLNNSTPSWDLNDLLLGKTELIPAYSTDEPYFVRKAEHTPVAIEPRDYGIDFYGDLLFTSRHMLEQQPEIVERFRSASLKGWQFALDQPQEIIEYIIKNYKTRNADYDAEFMRYEAEELKKLINPEIIQIGYINHDRWKKIASTYKALNLISSTRLDHFLYSPKKPNFIFMHKEWFILLALVFLIGIVVIFYFSIITDRLKKEIAKRHVAEGKLKKQAQIDGLTGIDNRYMLERNLEREFNRARRHQQALSMLIIDLDDFKQINDEFGHLGGDEVLKSFVDVSKSALRGSDFFARYGGEEFVALLPTTSMDEAVTLGQRILLNNANNTVVFDTHAIHYTISIGAAELLDSDEDSRELLQRTDKMLYKAKHSGKNCLVQNEQNSDLQGSNNS